MKHLILLTFSLIMISSFSYAQSPPLIKLNDLTKLLKPISDTTYVINFWATWCKPCIKELPYFDQLNENYKNKKVKVVLVCLDFKRHYETQLIPFLTKSKVKSEVVVLDEPDANLWIDLVDPSWGGAIPATLVINSSTGHRNFYEKEFNYSELENIVKPLILE